MDALRMGLATLGLDDRDVNAVELQSADPATNRRRVQAVVGAVPAVIGAYHRLRAGQEPIAPDPALGHAANYLRMLFGEAPSPARVRALDTYLNATVDHGMNASTFTARVIASHPLRRGLGRARRPGCAQGPAARRRPGAGARDGLRAAGAGRANRAPAGRAGRGPTCERWSRAAAASWASGTASIGFATPGPTCWGTRCTGCSPPRATTPWSTPPAWSRGRAEGARRAQAPPAAGHQRRVLHRPAAPGARAPDRRVHPHVRGLAGGWLDRARARAGARGSAHPPPAPPTRGPSSARGCPSRSAGPGWAAEVGKAPSRWHDHLMPRARSLLRALALASLGLGACIIVTDDDDDADGESGAAEGGTAMADGTGGGACFTPPQCDPLAPNCSESKCIPNDDAFACTPTMPGLEEVGAGEPCSSGLSCQAGLVCLPWVAAAPAPRAAAPRCATSASRSAPAAPPACPTSPTPRPATPTWRVPRELTARPRS